MENIWKKSRGNKRSGFLLTPRKKNHQNFVLILVEFKHATSRQKPQYMIAHSKTSQVKNFPTFIACYVITQDGIIK